MRYAWLGAAADSYAVHNRQVAMYDLVISTSKTFGECVACSCRKTGTQPHQPRVQDLPQELRSRGFQLLQHFREIGLALCQRQRQQAEADNRAPQQGVSLPYHSWPLECSP